MDGVFSAGRRLSALSFVVLTGFLLLELQPSHGCPFCLNPPQTLAEQMSRADIVLIAELVRFRVSDHGKTPESTLRIREYLHGQHFIRARREFAAGQPIVIRAEAAGKTGDLFLMFGDLPEEAMQTADSSTRTGASAFAGGLPSSPVTSATIRSLTQPASGWSIEKASLVIPEFISWNDTAAVSAAAVDYLRRVPAREISQPERLEYFVRFLEHQDPVIAIDAWAEFACSSYEDVAALKNLMPREKLRAWIADPLMSPDRLGLYGMMLGLCGSEDDASFLMEQMDDPDQPGLSLRFGSDGLMAGYLLLTGEHGLQMLTERYIRPENVPDTAIHAFVQALQFMWSCERDRIPEVRILEAMRPLLKHRSMREIAIANLSRWEDWSTLPELIAMFDSECADDRFAQRAILQFAQACVKAGAAKEPARKYADDAAQFISRVRNSMPELLASPRYDFNAPQ